MVHPDLLSGGRWLDQKGHAHKLPGFVVPPGRSSPLEMRVTPDGDGALLRAGFHSAEADTKSGDRGELCDAREPSSSACQFSDSLLLILKSVVFKGHQPCEQGVGTSVHPGWTNSGAVTIPLSQGKEAKPTEGTLLVRATQQVGLASRALSLSSLSIPAQFSAQQRGHRRAPC